jgi:hypothetical protein
VRDLAAAGIVSSTVADQAAERVAEEVDAAGR